MKCEACGHENMEGARFCAGCGAAVPTRVEGGLDPLVGQVIGGRFHITGVLGEGGMGIVYVGEQQMGSTVRKVAVKTLHAHLSKDASVMARFHRECGTVAQLEHPNTIKVYDFGSTKDGTLYIAMEFVSGKSLADVLLAEGALPKERVTHILRQVCGALDEAHLQGIVHRDLKPENVILSQRAGETDFVTVLDFGIAARSESSDEKKEQKLTQQGMVLGTPPYMSPEQFTGKPLDARSDVYSLGIMAYEMLTGKLPFDADTPWQWASQHMTAPPRPFEVTAPHIALPESVKQAVLRALAKDREQRPPSARDFFSALSGGARITVEASALGPEPQSPIAYQATAAMPAVPGAGGGALALGATVATPMVASPGQLPQSPPGGPTPGAMVSPVVAAPPSAPRRGGGGKGLLIGLGIAAAALAGTIAVVVVRSGKSDDKVGLLTTTLGSANSGPAQVTGEAPTLATDTSSANPDPNSTVAALPAGGKTSGAGTKPGTKPTAASNATGSATTATSGTVAQTGAGGTSTQTTGGQTTGSTTTGGSTPAAGGGCATCLTQAQAGNITGAAASFRSCTDTAGKAACSRAVRSRAPTAIQTAARNQNCASARAMITAASGMGMSAAALQKNLEGTSCK